MNIPHSIPVIRDPGTYVQCYAYYLWQTAVTLTEAAIAVAH